jgi:hypothetical protein
VGEREWEEKKIGEEDVKEFAVKLREWAVSLPPEEQALLGIMLERAQASDPRTVDVEGFEFPSITRATIDVLGPLVGRPVEFFNPRESGRWKLWKRGVSDQSGPF